MKQVKVQIGMEERVKAFIYGYIADNNLSPTLREIAEELKTSAPAVQYWVIRLKEKGFITFEKGKPRTIQIITNAQSKKS